MNVLYQSKRNLLISKILFWGGLVGSILSVFPDGPGLWFAIFLISGLAGGFWLDSMYRCPRCHHSLFTNRADALLNKPCTFCPKCGWKVEIKTKP